MCFKLDIESQIDKDMWETLKNDLHMIKSFQFARNKNMHFSPSDVFEGGIYEQITQESVFNNQIRNEWEKVKNKNLDSNKITIIIKCQKCNRLLLYLYDIEHEMLDKVGVKLYDFVNEINHIFGF